MPESELLLATGQPFASLYGRDGLIALDRAFLAALTDTDAALEARLLAARAAPDALDRKAESRLLLDLAPHVEDFIAWLFGFGAEVRALAARHNELAPLYMAKRLFVQRRGAKAMTPDAAQSLDGAALAHALEVAMGEALGLLLRQLGPALGQRRFRRPTRPPGAEPNRRAAHRAMARALPEGGMTSPLKAARGRCR